ncbi:hypothetical protein DRE_06681 [Drechslerella stenobrocha 248]|uniref:pH-response transcription factor pacC/RIM101 n=1 Tax=Drechslerella stenobrocha 248 TaxID=1043628 RepID=W7I6T7_9PEZI|nr:hypothetical protein DRE_06681 [Drechslerella stenobrocha 248]
MDIVNILNKKETRAGNAIDSSVTASSSTQTTWSTPDENNGQSTFERQELIRLPSLAAPTYSTYPHSPYTPRYSFESQQSPPATAGSSRPFSPTEGSSRAFSPTAGSSRAFSPTALSNGDPSLGDDPSKPYHCKTCQKGFARRSDLSRHERIHSGVRPHVCEFEGCGKQFIQRSALTVHARVHTGEKPHMCEACGKPFSDSSSLARHRRIHSGKRPYKCPYADCQKTFTRRTTLTRHQNHHTGTISEAAAATAAALASRRSSSKSSAQSLQLTGSTAHEENMESVSQSRPGPNSSLRLSQGGSPGADLDKQATLAWCDTQNYQAVTSLPTPASTPIIPANLVAGAAALHISDSRPNGRGLPPVLSIASQPRSLSPLHTSPSSGMVHRSWQPLVPHGSPRSHLPLHVSMSLSPQLAYR